MTTVIAQTTRTIRSKEFLRNECLGWLHLTANYTYQVVQGDGWGGTKSMRSCIIARSATATIRNMSAPTMDVLHKTSTSHLDMAANSGRTQQVCGSRFSADGTSAASPPIYSGCSVHAHHRQLWIGNVQPYTGPNNRPEYGNREPICLELRTVTNGLSAWQRCIHVACVEHVRQLSNQYVDRSAFHQSGHVAA